jgi:catechol 2,3-dioxygenase-like lactoylglutathione lyase family enzyme
MDAIRTITFDCADAAVVGAFWKDVLGWEVEIEPDGSTAFLANPDGGTNVLFLRVPESKQVKNRVHLDLTPTDRTRDQEVERLRDVGAIMVGDHRQPDGTGWVVMADPEGNEFCVERSAAERGG